MQFRCEYCCNRLNIDCLEQSILLIAIRAKVESADHCEDNFEIHGDFFKTEGVKLAHMGVANAKTVIAVFETNDPYEPKRIFYDPATGKAMSEDKITGGVEMFLLDDPFEP